jgi:hypothetical protein
VHGSKKEGARWAYTGIRALNPITGFVRETGDTGCTAGFGPAMCIPPTAQSASSGSAITRSKTLPMPSNASMDSGYYDKDIVTE